MNADEALKHLHGKLQQAIEEWFAEWDKNGTERIHKMLSDHVDHVVAGLMGFDKRWGRWELCVTNGKETFASRWIEGRVEKAIDSWLHDNFADATDMLKLPEETVDSVRKNFVRKLEYKAQCRIDDLVDKEVERIADLVDKEVERIADEWIRKFRVNVDGLELPTIRVADAKERLVKGEG